MLIIPRIIDCLIPWIALFINFCYMPEAETVLGVACFSTCE